MTGLEATETNELSRRRSSELVGAAVRRNKTLSKAGLNERAFTLAFSSLVYPQIWEDPAVDMDAMELEAGQHVIAIASGGCNLLSYLTAAPVRITAVDLNTAHIALNRLKITAAQHLPTYQEFFRFFGRANSPENIAAFNRHIRMHLDAASLDYWTGRGLAGTRRINSFSRGFYRHGLLGRFIAAGHLMARLYGKNPGKMMSASTWDDQRRIFESELKPLFEKRLVRFILDQRSSLFGLGIPPAQYDALAGGRPMHEVIQERLERLACDFDLRQNYFAWQAFNRGYGECGKAPLPPYLEKRNFERVRERSKAISIHNVSLTAHLSEQAACSFDRYVLLDAQDWMPDSELGALWMEITRTARPGARVIFRTAGIETILPGRISHAILDRWHYEADKSQELMRRDRSAIYGGFHIYHLKGA